MNKSNNYLQWFQIALLFILVGIQAQNLEIQKSRLKAEQASVEGPVQIEESNVDDRGLYCVKFKQGGKEWGLDFLTKKEFDSLKNVK